MTASVDDLCRQLGWVAELRSDQIAGAHLEGPFLSVARCGAQNPDHMIPPDLGTLRTLIHAARGALATITIAPELPGSLELIRAAASEGIVVAIGHSDADYGQALAGYDAGATLTTHLFNGMPPLHHRAPGVAGAALGSGAWYEIINDGLHVHPSLISLVASEPERLLLITDAIDATGAPDGDYVLGGQAVRVADGEARLASNGALAGSTLTMDRAVRRAVRDCGLPIQEAAAAAAANPARVLGLSGVCGAIRAGLAADLVAMDSELNVVNVMKNGRWTNGRSTTAQGG
jgi:N-acetylglucosamine-6-phosphate deacetylase